MAHKKQTSRPMTEKEKQVVKRKLHKAELEGIRHMLKDGMKISVDEIIEAIEKEPNGQLALQFFMKCHGEFIVDNALCKSEPTDTPDKIKKREEHWDKIKEVFYNAFYHGLVVGATSYKKIYEQDLKTLREIKEQDDKAASDVAASK